MARCLACNEVLTRKHLRYKTLSAPSSSVESAQRVLLFPKKKKRECEKRAKIKLINNDIQSLGQLAKEFQPLTRGPPPFREGGRASGNGVVHLSWSGTAAIRTVVHLGAEYRRVTKERKGAVQCELGNIITTAPLFRHIHD